jgi:hypothetical protein
METLSMTLGVDEQSKKRQKPLEESVYVAHQGMLPPISMSSEELNQRIVPNLVPAVPQVLNAQQLHQLQLQQQHQLQAQQQMLNQPQMLQLYQSQVQQQQLNALLALQQQGQITPMQQQALQQLQRQMQAQAQMIQQQQLQYLARMQQQQLPNNQHAAPGPFNHVPMNVLQQTQQVPHEQFQQQHVMQHHANGGFPGLPHGHPAQQALAQQHAQYFAYVRQAQQMQGSPQFQQQARQVTPVGIDPVMVMRQQQYQQQQLQQQHQQNQLMSQPQTQMMQPTHNQPPQRLDEVHSVHLNGNGHGNGVGGSIGLNLNGNGNGNSANGIAAAIVVATQPGNPSLTHGVDRGSSKAVSPTANNGHGNGMVGPSFKIPLPPWLQAMGEKKHSEKQQNSTSDLSKIKKKYRQSYCLYCARVFPQSPWAAMKSRKYEHEIFKKHEKSNLHQRALIELNKSVLGGSMPQSIAPNPLTPVSTPTATTPTANPQNPHAWSPLQAVPAHPAPSTKQNGTVPVPQVANNVSTAGANTNGPSKPNATHVVSGLGLDPVETNSRGTVPRAGNSKYSKAAVTAELGLSQGQRNGGQAVSETPVDLVTEAGSVLAHQPATIHEREMAQRMAMAIPSRSIVTNDHAMKLNLMNGMAVPQPVSPSNTSQHQEVNRVSPMAVRDDNVDCAVTDQFRPGVGSSEVHIPVDYADHNMIPEGGDKENTTFDSISNSPGISNRLKRSLEDAGLSGISVDIDIPNWARFGGEICHADGTPVNQLHAPSSDALYRSMFCQYCSSFESSPTDWGVCRIRPLTNATFAEHSSSAEHERAMIALELAQLSRRPSVTSSPSVKSTNESNGPSLKSLLDIHYHDDAQLSPKDADVEHFFKAPQIPQGQLLGNFYGAANAGEFDQWHGQMGVTGENFEEDELDDDEEDCSNESGGSDD